MFISNLIPLVVLLQLQVTMDLDKRNITLTGMENYYFPSCAAKPWNIEKVFVMNPDGVTLNKKLNWYVNLRMGKRGTTTTATPLTVVRVNHDEVVNLPICRNGEMIVFEMELVGESTGATAAAAAVTSGEKRIKRDTEIKQSWSGNEYYQVMTDGEGIELTVRINRNHHHNPITPLPTRGTPPPPPPPPPAPTTATTTSTTVRTTTARGTTKKSSGSASGRKRSRVALSENCRQYQTLLRQTMDWGFEELKRLEERSDDAFCSDRLPASATESAEYP